ncbi:hypothetical protein [Acinetobacter rongchengensis]|uniref:Uncharacterized protein n=1 Tax=Acinetobacter rongchengensis TaxID=2419601 RepID=A0A3A8F1E8_9GAMM|nr:hypothetical protein [Acinetobacter rongchengensis]RKG40827.1 hypothetical protein D7V20_00080 [Acinetobacter rongchengensis]
MHKKLLSFFLFFGITITSYADDFQIKHIYVPIVRIYTPPMSTARFPIAISTDNDVITAEINGKVSNDDFGVFKTPLSIEMKNRMLEINRLLRLPHIEKILITNNPNGDFWYKLDVNHSELTKQNLLKDFEVDDHAKTESSNKSHNLKEKNSQAISQYFFDLVDIGYSKDKVKFADFYGITNIIPKDYGLLVVLTLKNVGPFDVTLSNPKEWQDILKDEFYEKYEKKWYELNIGGLYKGEGCWMHFTLLPKYLIKEDLNQEELSGDSLKISSNSERVIRFLIPYKEIKVKLNNGDVDTNRTKEGYIHLDHNAAIILSNWNLDISFGDLFSKRTWKEEKSSQVKGWVNLE